MGLDQDTIVKIIYLSLTHVRGITRSVSARHGKFMGSMLGIDAQPKLRHS